MNSDVADLLARMAAQREHWVDLPDGKRVQYRRPQEVDLPGFMQGVQLQHVVDHACGWAGFSAADLLGAAVASSDPLPFDTALWEAVVRDRADYLPVVAEAMLQTAADYLLKRASTAKNSPPSST